MTEEKSKEWQMELLMEKIRAKAPQFKPLGESAKALRMSILVWLLLQRLAIRQKTIKILYKLGIGIID